MATYVKIHQFVEDLAEKVHDLSADQLTAALVIDGDPPVQTDSVLADLTGEIAYTNLSSRDITTTSSLQNPAGTYKLTLTDLVLTASGTVATFQWVVIYNNGPASPLDPLIGYYDHGSSVTLATSETYTIDFPVAGTGWITLV